jgi:hypothetical protein
MKLHDVLQRLRLLRTVRPEEDADEAENAVNLTRILRERFSVGSEDVASASSFAHRISWVDWQDSLGEFGIQLRHFGRRGTASLGNSKQVVIRLDSGQWQMQQRSPGGWETVARDWGRESLRAYLIKNGPPRHPLFKRRQSRTS